MASSKLRIVVLGYVVRGPLAGLAWHYLQYVLGLARLGHDVYFFEDSDDQPTCYNPDTNDIGTDPSYGLRFLSDALEALGLPERWAYYDAPMATWRGPCADRAPEICATADLCPQRLRCEPDSPLAHGRPGPRLRRHGSGVHASSPPHRCERPRAR